MIRIPLAAVPIQTLAIVLNGQACEIALRQNGQNMYFDLNSKGQPVVRSRIVRNKQRLLIDAKYRGFKGDFLFNDLQGDTQPAFADLDTRYVLYYLTPSEIGQ
jgi:hypothetical protein